MIGWSGRGRALSQSVECIVSRTLRDSGVFRGSPRSTGQRIDGRVAAGGDSQFRFLLMAG